MTANAEAELLNIVFVTSSKIFFSAEIVVKERNYDLQ